MNENRKIAMATSESDVLLNRDDVETGQTPPKESTEEVQSEGVDNQEYESSKPSCIFIFFRIHNLIGIISLFLMAVAQGFPSPHTTVRLISGLQEFYILLACSLGAIVELDLSKWLIDRVAPILNEWLSRGAFYLFLAVIATEQSIVDIDDSKIEDEDSRSGQLFTALLLNISAGGLFVTGCLYITMGLFCMKGLKERSERENDKRLENMLARQRSNR